MDVLQEYPIFKKCHILKELYVTITSVGTQGKWCFDFFLNHVFNNNFKVGPGIFQGLNVCRRPASFWLPIMSHKRFTCSRTL